MQIVTSEEQWLLQEKYAGQKNEAYFSDCQRLVQGEPIAYIIGSIPFVSTTIFLDTRPLIPRTETEYWTNKAIEAIKQSGIAAARVLDLCAGSGCIGCAIGKAIPSAVVHFAEIEEVHHPTILKNIQSNGLDERSSLIFGGDLFEHTQPLYDFILTNPPYIATINNQVEQSVIDFEPPIALYGGETGMESIKKIISQAPHQLTRTGVLYIEHDPQQEEPIKHCAQAHGMEAITHNDQFDTPRYSCVRMAQ